MIFYKTTCIDHKERPGYYCVKRKWSWIVAFAFILIYRSLINIFLEALNIVDQIYSYNIRYITTPDNKPRKLTSKQKEYIIKKFH